MTRPLRALIVEDDENDALLLIRELTRGGFDVTFELVQTEPDMRRALTPAVDIVLTDYSMPQFDAMRALEVLKGSGLDLPLIVVSGTIGEETAVSALKAGAHDIVIKGRLARLVPVIERELREADSRRQRRLAEQQLRSSERQYRRIVETTREGIWVLDEHHRTSYVNQRMAEMLGATPEQLLGASFFEHVGEEWRAIAERHRGPLREASGEQHDLKLRRAGGSEVWVSLSIVPIVDELGSYGGALAMVTDTTAQRRLQAQLMMSDRLASVGMLAAGVAHEINNPLATLAANVALALQELTELAPEVSQDRLRSVLAGLKDAHDAASRLRQIVRDIKLFSAPESEKRVRVNVQEVLETTLRLASNELRHRARVVRDYQPVPDVEANESRLGQVFLNVIVNAAQAIPEGHAENHEVRVTTRRGEGGQVLVEISDTGSGIESANLERLFVPFFSTKPVGVGTGLGLSICHRIVSSLGGQIEVESEPGKGALFRVVLPPAAPNAARPHVESARPPTLATRRGRVLIIDDEPTIVSAAARTLVEHDVTTAYDGEEALQLIRAGQRFDVIICDLMMPQVTGMEMFEEILRTLPEQAERVVFLTGGAFTPRARAFLEEVSNERMEKPFEPSALRALVNSRIT